MPVCVPVADVCLVSVFVFAFILSEKARDFPIRNKRPGIAAPGEKRSKHASGDGFSEAPGFCKGHQLIRLVDSAGDFRNKICFINKEIIFQQFFKAVVFIRIQKNSHSALSP